MRERRMKVMVVDDNEDFLVLWRILLDGDERFEPVRCASNAGEAMDLLSADGPVDVVLADVWMAELSGHDLAEHIRQTHPATTVVLTSCAEGEDEEALRRGASAYVNKRETIDAQLGALLWDVARRSPAATSTG